MRQKEVQEEQSVVPKLLSWHIPISAAAAAWCDQDSTHLMVMLERGTVNTRWFCYSWCVLLIAETITCYTEYLNREVEGDEKEDCEHEKIIRHSLFFKEGVYLSDLAICQVASTFKCTSSDRNPKTLTQSRHTTVSLEVGKVPSPPPPLWRTAVKSVHQRLKKIYLNHENL